MRVAVSNIAWQASEEGAAADLLRGLGTDLVEVAPSRVWPDPPAAGASELLEYRQWWESRGFRIVALQALLFARPDLAIFGDAPRRRETLEYLRGVIAVGQRLGASALVFGSPKNRLRGQLTAEQAEAIAVPFFREVGDAAAEAGLAFCLEPNPPQYGCDFITTGAEGGTLAERVRSAGFGLHLDAAAMHLVEDDPALVIPGAVAHLRHFHASAPYLAPVTEDSPVDYRSSARALLECGYGGVVSIEMKAGSPGGNLQAVERAVEFVTGVYGDA